MSPNNTLNLNPEASVGKVTVKHSKIENATDRTSNTHSESSIKSPDSLKVMQKDSVAKKVLFEEYPVHEKN